jgi:hypothetical protein
MQNPRPLDAPPVEIALRPRKGTPETAVFLALFAAVVREQQERADANKPT